MSSILFSFLSRLVQKQKFLSLAPEMLDLGIFELEFENSILIRETGIVEFIQLENFVKKIKMPIFGTKNGLFSYVWTRTLRSYCNI